MTFNEYDIILKKIINLNKKNMPVATILEEKIADRLIEISKTSKENYKKFYRISQMLIRRIARRENRQRLQNKF